MKLRKFIQSPFGVGIITTAFGVFLTFLLDYLKSAPMLSTLIYMLSNIIRMLYAFFRFKIEVWLILTVVVVFSLIRSFILKFGSKEQNCPTFKDYKSDIFKYWKWSWEWKFYNGAWRINNLKANCPKCGATLLESSNIFNEYSYECPRCNFQSYDEKDEHPIKIEQLILDKTNRM